MVPEMTEMDFMRLSDVSQVAEIERMTFKSPWSENAFKEELTANRDRAVYLVIRREGKVVAYGGMWYIFDEAHVTNIAVHSDYRGEGLGRDVTSSMLKVAALDGILRMTLEVRVSNDVAVKLYSSLGFESVGRRSKFYEDGEDAFIMWNDDISNFEHAEDVCTPNRPRLSVPVEEGI